MPNSIVIDKLLIRYNCIARNPSRLPPTHCSSCLSTKASNQLSSFLQPVSKEFWWYFGDGLAHHALSCIGESSETHSTLWHFGESYETKSGAENLGLRLTVVCEYY